MAGRRPKPTALKKLAGNPGRRPLNENEPKFRELKSVEPPEWMGELAITMWETIVPEMIKNKLLTVPDLHNVEAFCMAYQRWREAEQDININGLVIHTEKSVIKNPSVTIVNESKKQMAQFGALLGLDPSSRTRLTGMTTDNKPTNPFADL